MQRPTSLICVRPALCLLGMSALTACGNLTGLDGASKFSCKAPEGVHCTSVTANYFNRGASAKASEVRASGIDASPVVAVQAAVPLNGLDPMALRSPVRLLRLWIKAWEDSDRDLADQSYVYVRVDDGHWQIKHVQRAERDTYAPLRPPVSAPASQPAMTTGTAAPREGIALPGGAMATSPATDATRP